MACILGLGFWPMDAMAPLSAGAMLAQERMQRTWDNVRGGKQSPRWTVGKPVARLLAKGGDVDVVILSGDAQHYELAPEHLPSSVLPGRNGNCVIAGRADLHFQCLKNMAIGESLCLETPDGRAHSYEIIDLGVVHARRSGLRLDSRSALLTLVSNYPFKGERKQPDLRYVVTARQCA